MMKIELKHPIKVDGEEITAIEIERPKVKHLKAIDKVAGDVAKAAALISEIANIPPSSVDQMDAEDFAVVTKEFDDFFS